MREESRYFMTLQSRLTSEYVYSGDWSWPSKSRLWTPARSVCKSADAETDPEPSVPRFVELVWAELEFEFSGSSGPTGLLLDSVIALELSSWRSADTVGREAFSEVTGSRFLVSRFAWVPCDALILAARVLPVLECTPDPLLDTLARWFRNVSTLMNKYNSTKLYI